MMKAKLVVRLRRVRIQIDLASSLYCFLLLMKVEKQVMKMSRK